MKRLYASLIVVTLLFVPSFWRSEGAKPEAPPQATTVNPQNEQQARRKAAFKKGRELLLQKNLPFDPNALLEKGWQQKLKRNLDQVPELQLVQQGGNKLKGAHLAHTLYLPDNIQLTGDTVILVRRLVFLGRNVVIKGPHDLHILPSTKLKSRTTHQLFKDTSLSTSVAPEGTSGFKSSNWLSGRLD